MALVSSELFKYPRRCISRAIFLIYYVGVKSMLSSQSGPTLCSPATYNLLEIGVLTVIPEELRYNSTHEWVGLAEEDGRQLAVIGISGFALEQLTDLVYMELPSVGDAVVLGQQFGEVESVKAVSPLYSPVSGTVTAVNQEATSHLDRLGDDPYGSGWLIKVQMENSTELDQLLDYSAYISQCAS